MRKRSCFIFSLQFFHQLAVSGAALPANPWFGFGGSVLRGDAAFLRLRSSGHWRPLLHSDIQIPTPQSQRLRGMAVSVPIAYAVRITGALPTLGTLLYLRCVINSSAYEIVHLRRTLLSGLAAPFSPWHMRAPAIGRVPMQIHAQT